MSEVADPNVMKMPYGVDFSMAAAESAASRLGVLPRDCVVYCVRNYAPWAQEVTDKYGCVVHLVPNEILKDMDHWAVVHGHRVVWSTGA